MSLNQEIFPLIDILERGDKEFILTSESKDAVLVLGNSGVGVSTFLQWIAGDTKYLTSQFNRHSELVIEDNNVRIRRHCDTKFKTLFPESIVDSKKNITFYD